MEPGTVLRVRASDVDPARSREITRLLERDLAERTGIKVITSVREADIVLGIGPGPGEEGYRIEKRDRTVHIIGQDPAGLLYGVGRFLHSSVSGDGVFTPGAWLGASAPTCPIRGIYFAHNHGNWYTKASLPEITRYLEDLVLWGMNVLVIPCDTNPPSTPADLENIMLPRQMELIGAARRLGLRIGMLTVANTILTRPDPEIAAVPVPDADPPRRGQQGHRVCPSTSNGLSALSARFQRSLDAYASVGLDFVIGFPYDEGGCGCERCRPWGGNGYIKACKELSRLTGKKYPDCRFVIGTWCFDVLEKPEGEYDGLDRAIRAEPGWCDLVMCDSHGDYPEWPLAHGTPGGLPMINFAEISMWGRWPPRGGYNANPFPRRLSRIWSQSRHLLSGGIPYSEGRYEDFNKVACLSLFWNNDIDPDAVVKEYAGYEFGTGTAAQIAEAVRLMEEIHPVECRTREKADRIYSLIREVETGLSQRALSSWRWELLRRRAEIDREATHEHEPVQNC